MRQAHRRVQIGVAVLCLSAVTLCGAQLLTPDTAGDAPLGHTACMAAGTGDSPLAEDSRSRFSACSYFRSEGVLE